MLRSFISQKTFATCTSSKFSYTAKNEPMLGYAVGSPERSKLESALSAMTSASPLTVPVCIGDEELTSSQIHSHPFPFDNKHTFVNTHMADEAQVRRAVASCLGARDRWSRMTFADRAAIFLRASDLVAGPYRYDLLAATMLGQGKTIFQAEIDAAAELADFFRFNVQFGAAATAYEPISPVEGDCVNRMVYRPTEGFWAVLPPFNFTAIGGNLAAAPALMGNVCVWKPSDSSTYSNYLVYKILREAGVPAGVINFVPCNGPKFGSIITRQPELAGINFTGSTKTYQTVLKNLAENIEYFNTYPRAIGECGGKNYHFVHPSADVEAVALATLRSAFEYSGQKCSACSRLYAPRSLWPRLRENLRHLLQAVKVGSPLEKDTFTSAVIDQTAFEKITGYLDYANKSKDISLVAGGTYNDSIGYYIQPTVYESKNPRDKIMKDDIFGPVVGVYVYEDDQVDAAIDLVDTTSAYGLTGSVFARDEDFIQHFTERMIDSVGNLYVNAQSTGSVVGNQPFGGARLSGTNDKAGGPQYVMRFTSPLSIKTQLKPIASWCQAHMK